MPHFVMALSQIALDTRPNVVRVFMEIDIVNSENRL
jgi:hypothetical protein